MTIEPIKIDMTDDEKDQHIAMLEGMLEQQRRYTDNALRNCSRLSQIVCGLKDCSRRLNKIIEKEMQDDNTRHGDKPDDG